MALLRFLGRLFVALALITLLSGVAIWLAGTDVTAVAGQVWANADIESLNLMQVVIQRHLHLPALWDSVIVPHLLLRATWESITILFVLFLMLGGLFLRLGRRPPRPSGLRR
ncbi:MAG: hypothetical protein O3B08_15770 [Proteobacteria bacterium]|nr:hypothetical protein [Pseudomonadota bacterium]